MVTLRAIFHYFYTVHRNSHSFENSNVKKLHSPTQETNIYTSSLLLFHILLTRDLKYIYIYAWYVLYIKYVYINVLQIYRLSNIKNLSDDSKWLLHWFPRWVLKSIYIQIKFF